MKPALLALLLASATTAGAGRWQTDQGDVEATCVMTIGQLRCEDDAQRVADGTGSSTALDGSVVVDLRRRA